ncbi:type I DNA topoisomerase [Arthrobacter sp. AL08]|uniref:type I DNA topoisomerase n=1 Tax=Micrococcaceae TaxID=1268 RepID=UPI00249C25DB|nr:MULTISPECIES: type I DNA topoisomerase [Micrococcaceae]MDI3240108.1 type I DNA topoisomerase [Arthrobacter sp. AL05]MDI3276118.1 type I DNA topoisomerase [Arthrobacter sp. AL08]MDJ0353876.1 type I DNA topoisomerase [Pseudarthrobacter sp. PH31-O2]
MPSKAKTGKKLVIVESPAKSKTIAKYLGEGFIVEASVGHIRDLPQPSELPAELKKTSVGKFAVDIDNDFKPYYVVSPDKKKKVAELKAQLKDADALYLATDGDREGEAIAWHLLEVLKPKVPVYRMTFGEITKEAIHRAMDNLRDVDQDLVDAQETRRVLDRLYGYEISPVLWRKVARGLSAGRVQSVVTRMVVARERERMAFTAASYWDLTGQFGAGSGSFKAKLALVDGAKVASGRDFNDSGELTSRNAVHLNEELARSLAAGLQGADFRVRSVDTKPYTRRPAAPFTTSTLQQEAGRKLRFSSKSTMQVAQRLYENGYITYMRTDSSALSNEAVTAARRQASELYGAEYVPASPRVYSGKAANAQEAHEAIRPAGDSFRTPAQVAKQLSGDEFRLYELIWKRTVASQMADAKGSTATIRLGAVTSGGAAERRDAEFSASGTVITFPGFLAAYEEGKDESRGDEDSEEARRLPNVAKDDALTASDIVAVGHETSPPPRFTEASLTAELEKKGIGRPSTYASTISTIQDRGYVRKQGSALVPSWIAFSVVRLLEQHFHDYVDYEFTADMEADLDKIANGQAAGPAWLKHFYFGEDSDPGLLSIVNNLGEIDARDINSIPITDAITLRVGKFGPYLESSVPMVDPKTGEVVDAARANVPEDLAPDELTAAKAVELMETAAPEERVLGADPHTGHTVVAKNGRYGAYVTEIIPEMTEEQLANQPVEYYKNGKPKPAKKPVKAKPRTGSLFASMSVESISLADALELMSLPRVLGQDAEGNPITVQNGRFGPYLKKGTDSRSIGSEEEIFTITLEQALEIYSQPKQRGARAAVPPLAEFGPDPVSEKNIVVKEGRFGPYITDGVTNITVPRSTSVEELTREQAVELLADKRARGPVKRTTAARKAPARKAAAKK